MSTGDGDGLSAELAVLIATLHATELRLEELTGGQVDAITDSQGRSWMLRGAQDSVRAREAQRQAAILDALPASIALIDADGVIRSVNTAWLKFAHDNAGSESSLGVGRNYLTICDAVYGPESNDAHRAAAGIRGVLSGQQRSFSLEYPCDAPGVPRWYQLAVTPVAGNPPSGAVITHMNITEGKQTSQNLAESELRFRQLAENIPDVFFLRSVSGRMLYASPAYEEIWGRSRASLYQDAQSWLDSVHEDDRCDTINKLILGNPTGEFRLEYRVVRPDGGLRWVSSHAFPVRDESGELIRIAGVARDITERKRAASELLESERRFRDLLSHVQLVSVMLDLDGSISFCNDYLLRLTGWTFSEVSGKNWFDLFIPQPHIEIKLAFAELLRNAPESWHRENHIQCRNGALRLIRWSNSLLRSATGAVIGTASIGEDISEARLAEHALAQLRRQSDSILASVADGIYSVDLQGHIVLANPAAAQLLGYQVSELTGRRERETLRHNPAFGDGKAGSFCPIQQTMQDGLARKVDEAVFWRADGGPLTVEYSTAPLYDNANRLSGTVVAFRDITERKESAARIIYLNRVYAMLSGINTLIVRVRDRDELFAEACRIAVDAGGFKMAMIGIVDNRSEVIRIMASAGKNSELLEEIKQTLVGEWATRTMAATAVREKTLLIANDSQNDPRVLLGAHYAANDVRSLAVFPLLVADTAVGVIGLYASEKDFFQDEEITLLTELSSDIAFAVDYIDRRQQLDYLAYYDVLTGLANGQLFRNRLDKYLAAARQDQSGVCVLVIDLEQFTRINDSYGRSIGDEVLRSVAERMRQVLVEPFALGRISADTFAVASPSVQGEIPSQLGDAIHQALEVALSIAGREIKVSAQIGIALFPSDGENADDLYSNAESALRLSRSSGARSTYFSHALNAQIAQRYALEKQLRGAVAAREFVLHYQPRVDMISGELVGAEALIRWNHPQRGLVPPGEFIALAEDTGLIVPIGAWVLDRVCAQQAAWLAASVRIVPIAVNLSSVQFETDDLVQTVSRALNTHALAARWLALELTESAVMNDSAAATVTLSTLRKLGLGLALDDFGTGYSSLAHLKRFPFDSVKIDRSFVMDITRSPDDAAIATAIIAMAHGLKLRVVAEGVETQGQFNYLRLLGCDEMQGYLFSPAVGANEFAEQLRSHRRLSMPEAGLSDVRTLLIVDDELGIRAALTRMLRPDGYRVLHACSGQEGLDLLAVNDVQVIISDQRMPGMTGTEFLSTAATLYPQTVRMILSGFTDLNVVTEAVNRGAAFKFLTKPWNDEQLREHVREAFRRYRLERPNSGS